MNTVKNIYNNQVHEIEIDEQNEQCQNFSNNWRKRKSTTI